MNPELRRANIRLFALLAAVALAMTIFWLVFIYVSEPSF
jgi:hypothetical protein